MITNILVGLSAFIIGFVVSGIYFANKIDKKYIKQLRDTLKDPDGIIIKIQYGSEE